MKSLATGTTIVLVVLSSVSLAADLRTVAITSQSAPGTGGTFSAFRDNPIINSSGQTAFVAGIGGVGDAVFSEPNGALTAVAVAGQMAPGTTNTFRSEFSYLTINSSAQTAFLGELSGSSSSNEGFWSGGNGSLTLIAREGHQAPDTPAGADMETFFSHPGLNDVGQIAFGGGLETGSGGVSSDNKWGVWSGPTGSVTFAVRAGDPAPDTPEGALFSFVSSINLNNLGQIAFQGSLKRNVGGVTSADDDGIWSEGSGSLALVVREGDQALDGQPGVVFTGFSFPGFNDVGHTLFGASLSNSNGNGIWSDRGGSLAPVVRTGGQAPDMPVGAVFGQNFGSAVLNNSGQSAFTAELDIGSGGVAFTNNDALWSEGGGSLELVAREGSQAPDTPAGTNFSTLAYNSLFSVLPALNDNGQVAFFASLMSGSGDVTSSNDTGIWAEDRNGDLRLIVREGDTIDVDDGPNVDMRTISELRFQGGTNGSGPISSGFNDNGQVAFFAAFQSGGHGIFVSNLVAESDESADFDGDGDVDGHDFLKWQRGESPSPLSADDLALWETQYGSTNTSSAATSVPEPTSFALIWLLLLHCVALNHFRSARTKLCFMHLGRRY